MIEYTVSAATALSPIRPLENVELLVGPNILPTDPQTQKLIIQTILGWSMLDYYIRMALKRLTGKEITANDVVEMMSSDTHQKWIGELRLACASKDLSTQLQSDIFSAIDAVGTKRSDQKIYGRRNEVIHSIFGKLPDGTEMFQRIGDLSYVQSSPVSNAFLSGLVADIWDAISKINRVFPG